MEAIELALKENKADAAKRLEELIFLEEILGLGVLWDLWESLGIGLSLATRIIWAWDRRLRRVRSCWVAVLLA